MEKKIPKNFQSDKGINGNENSHKFYIFLVSLFITVNIITI